MGGLHKLAVALRAGCAQVEGLQRQGVHGLLRAAADACEKRGIRYKVGNIPSSDVFYAEDAQVATWRKMGVLAVEMEAAALYLNAARAGKGALAICTISDHLLTGEATNAEERQNSFTDMMTLALETAAAL